MKPLTFFIVVSTLILIACSTSSPLADRTAKELPYGGKSQPLTTQAATEVESGTTDANGDSIYLKLTPVTIAGENTEPHFSRDSLKILFISRERPEHAHSQVYELTLNPLRERRVTYHDGDDASPVYHPDGVRLLYSSTTDSLKNDPVFIENLKKLYSSTTASAENTATTARFDLFLSRLDGREIQNVLPASLRVRSNEAELTLDPKGRILAFTSQNEERADIFILPLAAGSPRNLSNDREVDAQPKFSFDGTKLIWVKHVPKGMQLTMSIVPFQKEVPVSEKLARHLYPSWHPSGDHIVFSSDRSGDGNLDLYIYSFKTKCLARTTRTKGDETSPVFSPDGKRLAFASNVSGRNQIYLAEMKDELLNGQFCIGEAL